MKEKLRRFAASLVREALALWLAARHPRTPLPAKLLAGLVAAYALSPIDLIPDFIPMLGYLDDLLIVPAGIWLALKLIPAEVMAECRERAAEWQARHADKPVSRLGVAFVILVWLLAGLLVWRAIG